jgi:hypothetical protein
MQASIPRRHCRAIIDQVMLADSLLSGVGDAQGE